jgi:hypothetical protein
MKKKLEICDVFCYLTDEIIKRYVYHMVKSLKECLDAAFLQKIEAGRLFQRKYFPARTGQQWKKSS